MGKPLVSSLPVEDNKGHRMGLLRESAQQNEVKRLSLTKTATSFAVLSVLKLILSVDAELFLPHAIINGNAKERRKNPERYLPPLAISDIIPDNIRFSVFAGKHFISFLVIDKFLLCAIESESSSKPVRYIGKHRQC